MENGTENKNPATHGNGRAHTVDTAKRKRIMIIAAVCLISVVIMAIAIPNCGGGTQGIEVISETLVTTPYYAAINGYLYPILLVKVKTRRTSPRRYPSKLISTQTATCSEAASQIS